LALDQSGTAYVPVAQNKDFSFPSGFHFTADQYVMSGNQPKHERLQGGQASSDTKEYNVVHKTATEYGPSGRYLVNEQGVPVYLVDPGINGIYNLRFIAPKATLMSYIIKGILSRKWPCEIVILCGLICIYDCV